MGRLKVLPAQIANMIAAGEVVQRPASVVKELMENAVDAGATQVSVIISDAGRTLIQVIDNGCGMTPAEAVLCFERHATSKIASAEDLERILSFGFRGEALASIAAVAEVTLRTRKADDETGTEVRIDASGVHTATVSAPTGSNFAVRNLFYNTPARRKFLKSDNVEFKHIVEEFTHIALLKPELSFTLIHNGGNCFVLRRAQSLKFRIQDLLGSAVADDLVDLQAETSLVHINGYVGRPDSGRKAPGNQFFFVNGRYFRSPYLAKAVSNAYAELMPEGFNPPYIINFELDAASVDVNVSPTKSEVKFEDESVLFQILYASVRETLGRSSFASQLDFNTEGSVQMPQLGASFQQYRPDAVSPTPDFDPSYNPFECLGEGSTGGWSPDGSADVPGAGLHTPYYPGGANAGQDFSALFDTGETAAPQRCSLVLDGHFILTQARDGVLLVHIRRAWQRIIYEQTLRSLAGGERCSMQALFPVEVHVGAASRLLFDDNAELLAALGFEISAFGPDSIAVSAVPSGFGLGSGEIAKTVFDMIPLLSEGHSALDEMWHAQMAEKMAAVGSLHCQTVSTSAQAQQLMDTLFGCDNSDFTPAGKKIAVLLSGDDFEKLF